MDPPDDLPPEPLQVLVGGTDFREVGTEFLTYFTDFGGLRPDDHVLDVGCGSGRMALPLTRFLGPAGRYEGFDVVPAAVEWCDRHIAAVDPRFRFQLVDLFCGQYNPAGRAAAEQFTFPYADGQFDFTIVTSVFTHLLPAAVHRYLSEVARTLRQGGRCLATFFLLNNDAEMLMSEGRSALDFYIRDRTGVWATVNRVRPANGDGVSGVGGPAPLPVLWAGSRGADPLRALVRAQ